ncbi:hypothetical protein [Rivibacter subsaxonicus]|uniref:Uncharacterized protein n=1 Tax=Rivibacter subsaxonicus TaxID=457575 RepID=A0A4V2FUP6_9BURK|nr:hypothetical protein [Rivibacter subsaxonicus]RZU02816.1 hypothetical protein EV670_0845 [Rivibacter subsaxonicus]
MSQRALRRRAMLGAGCGLLAGLSQPAASAPPAAEAWIEAWVELSEPVAAASSAPQAAANQRVADQQERVGRALAELGVVELARVRHARNAIAVRMPAGKREQVLAIPGVVGLRTTRSLHPPRPSSAASL